MGPSPPITILQTRGEYSNRQRSPIAGRVLTPVAASSGEKALQIYVATTREREISSGNVFTANRANSLNFAREI